MKDLKLWGIFISVIIAVQALGFFAFSGITWCLFRAGILSPDHPPMGWFPFLTNTFSSAFAKLKDTSKAEEFAEDYKAEIQGQHWMCGFPDKVVVISVADYVMMAYGAEECVDDLVEACSEVAPDSTVLVDAPAVLD